MKAILRKTAPLVAVFLLISLDGCYTTLRMANTEIETNRISDTADWHFGYGWYLGNPEYQDDYRYFYYTPWWDNCRWCGQSENDFTLIPSSEPPGGKIGRREPEKYYSGQYQFIPSADTAGGISRQGSDLDTVSAPIINDIKNTKTEQKPAGKIERRRGR